MNENIKPKDKRSLGRSVEEKGKFNSQIYDQAVALVKELWKTIESKSVEKLIPNLKLIDKQLLNKPIINKLKVVGHPKQSSFRRDICVHSS